MAESEIVDRGDREIHEDSNDVSLLLGERGHEFPTKIRVNFKDLID